ncbi:unnamed protein product [Closterium sp. NIES-64]|nr:unnamed protein product [Closterium sp. NIES-64]
MERLSERVGASTIAAPGAARDGSGGSRNCGEDRLSEGSTSSSTTVAHGASGEGELSIQGGATGGEQVGRASLESDAAAVGVGARRSGSPPGGGSRTDAVHTGGGDKGRSDGREQGAVVGDEIESRSNESSKSSGGMEVERSDKSRSSTLVNLAAATETGILVVLLTNPIWLAKTRLQLQGAVHPKGPPHHAAPASAASSTSAAGTQPPSPPGAAASRPTAPAVPLRPRQYRGFHDAIWSIVKEEGVRGLYRGIGPSLVLVSHGAIQMAAYEELKQLMLALRSPTAWAPRTPSPPHVDSHPSSSSLPAVTELSPWDIAAVGATAKLCAASATYPYQVVRARLQMRPDEAGQLKYRNTRHAVTSMWRLEGARGFYKGFLPNLLRVMPSASITFAVYEVMLRLLKPHPLAPPQAHF